MVKVPWSTRLGEIGEAAIKKRLSYFATVHRYDVDIGLDFFCELVEDDSPTLTFFVQAKGATHFDAKWGASVPGRTIRYWLSRPGPAFLVVYDDSRDECYWMSVEHQRYALLQSLESGAGSAYVSIDRSRVLAGRRGRHDEFIGQVKWDVMHHRLSHGQAEFIGDGYVKTVPLPPRTQSDLAQMRERTRANLYSLFMHYTRAKDLEIAQAILEFLCCLDKEHYNHFFWLGILSWQMGYLDKAKWGLETALTICEADLDWPEESMARLRQVIKGYLQALVAQSQQYSHTSDDAAA